MAKAARKQAKTRARPATRKRKNGFAEQLHRAVKERTEALEFQAATAAILASIRSSATDARPVFDAIVSNVLRLFGTRYAAVFVLRGEMLELAAVQGDAQFDQRHGELLKRFRQSFPQPVEDGTFTGKALRSGQVMQLAPIIGNPQATPQAVSLAKTWGYNSLVVAPLVRDGEVVGCIGTAHPKARRLGDKELLLLKAFADQAVIAIENVRLFNETKEALERQTATADILRVISASPTDIQPVLRAVAESAARLCEASNVHIRLVEGDRMPVVMHIGDIPVHADAFLQPISAGSPPGRALLERKTVHIHDVTNPAVRAEYSDAVFLRHLGDFRTLLVVPLIREGTAIGTITARRTQMRPFSEQQIKLLQTFAAQAVIAIENVRLFNETKESLERQTATADILRVISGSPASVQPVFEAILDNATRLCEAQLGALFLVENDIWNMVSHRGASLEAPGFYRNFRAAPSTGLGRMTRERQPVHIEDLLADAATSERDPLRIATIEKLGARTFLAVPLLKDASVLGAVVIYRQEVRPFGDAQIRLLSTFADQAVIAIENVRLFNETKEALEQQTAISEVLRVISSSPADVNPVLEAVAERAARICDAFDARIFLEEGDKMRHVAGFGQLPIGVKLGDTIPLSRGWVAGRAVLERKAIHIEDLLAVPADEFPVSRELQERVGHRTLLVVPLMREHRALGAITLRRMEVRPFTDKQIALLRTFADQAAIAIENVRLFNETKESLERQTATSEILKVISRTHFDLGPVLEIVLNNARTLCGADRGTIFRPDAAGNYVPLAVSVPDGSVAASLTASPIRTDRSSATGRAAVEGVTVHIPDVLADPEYRRLDLATVSGFRSVLAVPMLREGIPIGVLTLARTGEARPFNDKQIELVTVFADQAVIAIENVRLFNEIQEKSQQLEVANKHKSDFLANMSHELRTPLNAIIGFSEALMERMFGEVNDKQADYLKDIHESGKHLLSLINDILDLSKIEAGRMDLELSSFHLPTALSNAMTLVRERAQRHGIELGLEVDRRLGEFQADERKFKQIMLNLLSNAVKFTPDGGRVEVCATKDTDKIEIAVKDTGIGIAPEDQAAVFEEFKQVGRDQLRKAEGTGLGLALTRRFVELHGGAIRLESTPGKGSTFTVSLPLRAG
jgi:GAF domain-containing protein/anti-sigma regulatory factor (Ser/Thr protein kinase)